MSATKPEERSFWIAVICGALILTIGIGARQSFGIFQKPIAADLKVGRELWSFANALALLLMGVFSPFVGNIADRFGTARTVASGGALYTIGMFVIAFATEGVMLTFGNVLCGIGMAAAGFGPIFGSISRQTPPEKRSIALGVATAGGSFGQFAIVPFASLLQYQLDNWHTTMSILGVMSMVMVPLAVGLREHRVQAPRSAQANPQGAKDALQEAFQTQGFWLLAIGFFVCGFHVTFIGLHLPSYISDKAVAMSFFGRPISALELGGWAIGLVGLFNIVGSLIWGWLGSQHPKRTCWRCFTRCARWHSLYFSLCLCHGFRCCCSQLRLDFSGLAPFRLPAASSVTCSAQRTCRCCGASCFSATSSGVSWAAGVPDGSTTSRATTI